MTIQNQATAGAPNAKGIALIKDIRFDISINLLIVQFSLATDIGGLIENAVGITYPTSAVQANSDIIDEIVKFYDFSEHDSVIIKQDIMLVGGFS
mgnify:CR=1 FL=1